MKNWMPIQLPFLSILLTLAISLAAQAGGSGPGGGDSCGKRFDEVADDIHKWIHDGGPKGLSFEGTVTAPSYSSRMNGKLENYNVTCVKEGDPGWPVTVDGKAKECKNFEENGTLQIVCDRDKFYGPPGHKVDESDQYYMVHHEFASAAGLEPHVGPKSTYKYSNQITGYLENQVVKRLAIKPKAQAVSVKLSKIVRNTKQYRDSECLHADTTVQGYDADGKLRAEITQFTCVNVQTREYRLKLYSSEGASFLSEGIGMADGLRAMGVPVSPEGSRLQGFFFRVNAVDCQVIQVGPNGNLLGNSDCTFASLPEAVPDQPDHSEVAI